MHSIVQILKVNEVIEREWEGRKYKVQDCECLLLNDDGTPAQVGVLKVPQDLHGQFKEGVYIGSFAMRPDRKTRVLGAVLVGLQPYAVGKPSPVASSAAATPAGVK